MYLVLLVESVRHALDGTHKFVNGVSPVLSELLREELPGLRIRGIFEGVDPYHLLTKRNLWAWRWDMFHS